MQRPGCFLKRKMGRLNCGRRMDGTGGAGDSGIDAKPDKRKNPVLWEGCLSILTCILWLKYCRILIYSSGMLLRLKHQILRGQSQACWSEQMPMICRFQRGLASGLVFQWQAPVVRSSTGDKSTGANPSDATARQDPVRGKSPVGRSPEGCGVRYADKQKTGTDGSSEVEKAPKRN